MQAVEQLWLDPGASVLEISCGTGGNFPNQQARIGPIGRLVGVDYVYKEDGGSVVSIVDSLSMLGVVENPDLDPVAQEARARLQRVIEALGGQ